MSHYIEPEFQRSALITIDTQGDTLDGQPMAIPGTTAALPAMRRLLAAYRVAGRPIVHIVRIYLADGSNVDLCRRQAVEEGKGVLLAGTSGCELAPGLLPEGAALDRDLLLGGGVQPVGPGEVIIYKSRWGAFFQTPLHQHLQNLGVTTLVFSGCNYPNCPRASIYGASERDYRVVLVEDALSGLHEQGRREMAGIGVRLMNAQAVVEKITTLGQG